MMTDVVCHAKDFKLYPEGDRETFDDHFEFSKQILVIMDREVGLEAGKCSRRLSQSQEWWIWSVPGLKTKCWRPGEYG